MTSPTTSRFIIVCPLASRQLVNDTLRNIDPTSSGDPLTVTLRLASSADQTEVAVWGSWAMDDATNQALKRAIRDAGWQPKPTTAEMTVYADGTPMADGTATAPMSQAPAWGSGQRVWLFDGARVAPDSVLSLLGLATIDRFRF